MKEIKNVLICGAGMMGKGLAQVFSGCPDLTVTIHNRREREVFGPIRDNFNQLKAKGILDDAEIEARMSRINFTTDMGDDLVRNADIVIECVAEEMQTKQDLFVTLEDYCREDCIFATNTSVMSPTEIGSKCKHKERVVGTHFWNPAHLIPLVEVVRTDVTTDEVVEATMEVMTKAGKKPVLCKKDVPGFIANRLQHALWREAISIVERGIADAKTVDDACKYSFGLRLPYLPPLVNSDMVSTQLTYNIHNYVLKDLEDRHEASPLLKEMIDAGKQGFRAETVDGVKEGFMKYTEDEIAEINKGLNEYLIKMLYNK